MQRAYIHKALRGNQNNKVIETDANGNIVYGEKAAASSGDTIIGTQAYVLPGQLTGVISKKLIGTDNLPLIIGYYAGQCRAFTLGINAEKWKTKYSISSTVASSTGGGMGLDSINDRLITQSSTAGKFHVINYKTGAVDSEFTVAIPAVLNDSEFICDTNTGLMWLWGYNNANIYAVNLTTKTLVYSIATSQAIGSMFQMHNGSRLLAHTTAAYCQYHVVNTADGTLLKNNVYAAGTAGGYGYGRATKLSETTFHRAGHIMTIDSAGNGTGEETAGDINRLGQNGGVKFGNKILHINFENSMYITDLALNPLESVNVSGLGAVHNKYGYLDLIAEYGIIIIGNNTQFIKVKP
jgi:hypothetical protein